jgi:hypothetical protein
MADSSLAGAETSASEERKSGYLLTDSKRRLSVPLAPSLRTTTVTVVPSPRTDNVYSR